MDADRWIAAAASRRKEEVVVGSVISLLFPLTRLVERLDRDGTRKMCLELEINRSFENFLSMAALGRR